MTSKELPAHFKNAPWKTSEQVDGFVASLVDLQALDLLKVDLLGSKGLPGDALAQGMRLLTFAKLVEKSAEKSLFTPLVRALKGSSDPQLRSTLAQILPSVNSVGNHVELCVVLRSNDPQLRAVVAPVLSKIGGKTVFETLSEMVSEPNFPGRGEAMDVVVALGGHRAIPALQSVLSAGSSQEKIKALRFLAGPRMVERDRSGALQAMATAFADGTEAVVTQAIASVSAIASEDEYFTRVAPFLEQANLNLVKAALEGLRNFSSPRAIEALTRLLRAGPNTIRFTVMATLEAIGTDVVVPPLIEVLGHTQPVVRTRAAETLARLSKAGKLDLKRTIIWLLRSRDVNIRRMAVEILQSVPDSEGQLWPKLLEFLRDEDWWVRERVMDALVDMAGAQLVRHLVAYLKDPSENVRRFAVDALIRLKAPESLGALVRTATSDTDWWVRERAVAAIAAIKDQRAVPHIIDLMLKNPDLRVACVEALGAMGARRASAHVASLLPCDDNDLCVAVLRCLQTLGDTQQTAVVQDLLTHTRPTVRNLAREILHAWEISTGPQIQVVGTLSLLDQLLTAVARAEGDDLILKTGRRPFVKRMGKAIPLATNVLSAEQVKAVLMPHLSMTQVEELQALRDIDFSYQLASEALRFRANVFQEVGGIAAVFRIIKGTLLDLESLGLPPVVAGFRDLKGGLVLVGGPTGAGKSTTLAALIDSINRTYARHVISLEDPIEVVHARKLSLVNQREVGRHTRSFMEALRSTLREDPDVILVGEMRDFPTIAFAVTAAETGHLVLGTVHTSSAASSVDRLITACPPGQQDDVRSMLAGSLRAVVCQYLLRRKNDPGRVLAVEVMINNDAIASLIRKGKAFQIPSVITTSREVGMQLMDTELMRLAREGVISPEDAYLKATSKKDFEGLVPGQEGVRGETRVGATHNSSMTNIFNA
jgi:twitching motility protein PilT